MTKLEKLQAVWLCEGFRKFIPYILVTEDAENWEVVCRHEHPYKAIRSSYELAHHDTGYGTCSISCKETDRYVLAFIKTLTRVEKALLGIE